MDIKGPIIEPTGIMRCPKCRKILGKNLGDKVDIRICKGTNKHVSYWVKDGAITVKCLCGNICSLTKKAMFSIKDVK